MAKTPDSEPRGLMRHQPTRADVILAVEVLKHFSDDPFFDNESTGSNIGSLEERLSRMSEGMNIAGKRALSIAQVFREITGVAYFRRRFEADFTLGVESSIRSSVGFAVHHPRMSSDLDYQEVGLPRLVYPKQELRMFHLTENDSNPNQHIGIVPDLYTDSLGRRRLTLAIYNVTDRYNDSEAKMYNSSELENWVLRNESTGEVDSRLIVFEDLSKKDGLEHFIKIKTSGKGNMLEFRSFEPIKKQDE